MARKSDGPLGSSLTEHTENERQDPGFADDVGFDDEYVARL
jgi:hypothetical protein